MDINPFSTEDLADATIIFLQVNKLINFQIIRKLIKTRCHKSQAVDESLLAFYIYLSSFLINKFINDDLFREMKEMYFSSLFGIQEISPSLFLNVLINR